jgi:hypothetical protein
MLSSLFAVWLHPLRSGATTHLRTQFLQLILKSFYSLSKPLYHLLLSRNRLVLLQSKINQLVA